MDIAIFRVKYPNDPTGGLSAHQQFVGEYDGTHIKFYSVSSILGKEARVFGADSDDYEKIQGADVTNNGFLAPSFIDCTNQYEVQLDSSVDVSQLSHRNISSDLVNRIKKRIARKKSEGKHTVHSISLTDFKNWNKKALVTPSNSKVSSP